MLKKALASAFFGLASTCFRVVAKKIKSTFALTFLYCFTLILFALWLLLILSASAMALNL